MLSRKRVMMRVTAEAVLKRELNTSAGEKERL